MKGQLAGLMQQAQKMQESMKKAQEELANLEVTGEAGGGMVSVTVNGQHQVVKVKLEPSVVDPEDTELLEDLLAAAVNDATQKIQEASKDKMSGLGAGLQLPPGFKMPF